MPEALKFVRESEIEEAVDNLERTNISKLNEVLNNTAVLFNKENRLTLLTVTKEELEIINALKTTTSASHHGFYIEQVLDAYLNIIKDIGKLTRKVSYAIPFTNTTEDIMRDLTQVLITPIDYKTKKIGASITLTCPINFLHLTLYDNT